MSKAPVLEKGSATSSWATSVDVDAIVHVVRCFDDENVVHVSGRVSPADDIEVINTELALADLDTVEKKIQRAEKMARSGDKKAKDEVDFYKRVKGLLEQVKKLRGVAENEDEAFGCATCTCYRKTGTLCRNGQWTPAAHAAFERLQQAPDDGLDLRAFRVYSLDHGPDASMALGDVALSEAVAAYAFQASGGRIDTGRISRLIGSHPPVVGAAQALDEASKAADADKVLQSYNPQHPGYLALAEKLAEVRAAPEPMARLAATERGRGVSDAPSAVGPRRNADLESDILTNMEFWRWLPRDLGAERVVVNIPEFTARLYRDNALAVPFRVITGKPDKPTPLFSDNIEYLVVNPSWNVPQSIIKNEMMPKLDALRAQGYEIRTVNGRLPSASRRASATRWAGSSSSSPMTTPST